MYAILFWLQVFFWPVTDAVQSLWFIAGLNAAVALLVFCKPQVSRAFAVLAAVDIAYGILYVGYLIWAGWAHHDPMHPAWFFAYVVLGVPGVALSGWVYHRNRGFEGFLPVRGKWATRLTAALALTLVQFLSESREPFHSILLAAQYPQSGSNRPSALLAATVASVTLAGYYYPLWRVLVNGRKRSERAETRPTE